MHRFVWIDPNFFSFIQTPSKQEVKYNLANETSHFAEPAAAKEARSHYVPNAIQSIKTQRRLPGKHETDGREDFHARVAI